MNDTTGQPRVPPAYGKKSFYYHGNGVAPGFGGFFAVTAPRSVVARFRLRMKQR